MANRGIILPGGQSRTEYIRQEFARGRRRGDIARELGVPYQVVYGATYGQPQPSSQSQGGSGKSSPREETAPSTVSTRLPRDTAERLRARATLEQRSVSDLAARAIEEYLRAVQFPGIVFLTGADGLRKSKLLHGLDVWEYVFIARAYQGDIARTAEHLNQPEANVRLALDYHRVFPEEADAHIRYLYEASADSGPLSAPRHGPATITGSAMRLLLDAHISRRIAAALRTEGGDVVAAEEVGLNFLDDRPLWMEAIRQGRALVSYNHKHFGPLYDEFWQEQVQHPGLVLVAAHTVPPDDFGALIRALGRLLASELDLANRLIFLERADNADP